MATNSTAAAQTAPSTGGTVEPTNRAEIARERFQTPRDPEGKRYELRDPFAEVTHRTESFREAAFKANQLKTVRFVELSEDGKRTPITKVDGEWRRGPQLGPMPERPLDQSKTRDDIHESKDIATTPAARTRKSAEPVDLAKIAAMDATADRTARVAKLETDLADRYFIKKTSMTIGDTPLGRNEYRFRGDSTRVAFTETTFKLSTESNNPSVARSMVDVAEARDWKGLRVSGTDDFKRLVWLEASVRNVKTVGYEPSKGDLDLLQRERESRQVNRIEPTRDGSAASTTHQSEKSLSRGGGRKAVLAAIDAVLIAKGVSDIKRSAVMEAATEKLAERVRKGQVPKVKVFDKAAPSQRPVLVPQPQQQRTRDRADPAPAR